MDDFRKSVLEILREKTDLASREILLRVRAAGYRGGKTALYGLVASPEVVKPLVRFGELPWEFSLHDFGQYAVEFVVWSRMKPWRAWCAPWPSICRVGADVRCCACLIDRRRFL